MKYRTIVADPPWQYRKAAEGGPHSRRWAEDVYPTMPMAEIINLPIREHAEDEAHLDLWVTNPRICGDRNSHDGITPFDILAAWGFEYKTMLTWVKPIGLGSYFRGATEHVLFGVRGRLPIEPSSRESNVITAPRGEHSAKPQAFYDLVERVSPGPYLDLFARCQRFGWDTWGNQCFNHVEMAS